MKRVKTESVPQKDKEEKYEKKRQLSRADAATQNSQVSANVRVYYPISKSLCPPHSYYPAATDRWRERRADPDTSAILLHLTMFIQSIDFFKEAQTGLRFLICAVGLLFFKFSQQKDSWQTSCLF